MAIDSSHGHEMCTVGKLYVVKRGVMMVVSVFALSAWLSA